MLRGGISLSLLLLLGACSSASENLCLSCMVGGENGHPPTVAPSATDTTYFFLLDRLANGDRTNDQHRHPKNVLQMQGGDWAGVNAHQDYLNDSGFTAFLTTPFMLNRQRAFFGHEAGHGYWPIDHYKLDPRWGTWEQMQNFVFHTHENGHKFFLDVVLNHVDWDHPWVKEHPEYFHDLGPIKNWDDPRELVEGQVSGLPDLKQENEEVYQYLLRSTKFWLSQTDADGIRFDAVKHIDHKFWQRYLAELKTYLYASGRNVADFPLLAEILHGDPQTYLPYIADGFNAFYNYPLYYTLKEVFAENHSLFALAARLQELDRVFPPTILRANFIDNHDMPRFLDLNKSVTEKDLEQVLTVLYALRGMPVIYSGTEALVRGKTGEEGRKMFKLKRDHLFSYLQKLNKLRQQHPVLALGEREDLVVNAESYVFALRNLQEEIFVVIARPKAGRVKVAWEVERDGEVQDLLTGRRYMSSRGEFNLSVGKTVMFLARPFNEKNPPPPFNSSAAPDLIPLQIELKGAPPLAKLALAGNLDILGRWQPPQAVALEQQQATIIVPVGSVLEFKFIGVNEQGEVRWEERPNRYYFAQDPANLEFVWNH